MNTAARAGNRYAGPAVGSALPALEVNRIPAIPANSAEPTKVKNTARSTRIPTSRAALSFEPMLSILRPNGVCISTYQTTTEITINNQNGRGSPRYFAAPHAPNDTGIPFEIV